MSLQVDIRKSWKDFSLNVCFDLDKGPLGILGASGCGKSMTLNCIAGILRPDEGKIILNGRSLFDSEKKIDLKPQKRRVGYLFQDFALFPNMTVAENVGAGLILPKKEKQEQVCRMIDKFHLTGLEKKYPSQLSGGEQQMLAIARALMSRPRLLLLDEPSMGLAPIIVDQVFDTIRSINEEGTTVMLVEQNANQALRIASRGYVIETGEVVLADDADKLLSNTQVKEAYLGG